MRYKGRDSASGIDRKLSIICLCINALRPLGITLKSGSRGTQGAWPVADATVAVEPRGASGTSGDYCYNCNLRGSVNACLY
jgi:hypothetical protein